VLDEPQQWVGDDRVELVVHVGFDREHAHTARAVGDDLDIFVATSLRDRTVFVGRGGAHPARAVGVPGEVAQRGHQPTATPAHGSTVAVALELDRSAV
jgi:hypothetical protein